ncbi:hypothetical protein NC661_13235 [Aquibacillus koreensis]|uniref:Uncharacterized protein n=1 Tax=Aquibacillus koreensis TaxID=279446 RepID=A0A9X3WM55_9BACI|nr:hypothetical protein [Aquibacillus koreensis]MCT2536316.1 hypothetical protein [Aquibacillus koreensis]MDC3421333.1 hypothetical protein [Aquibacillus koreensis]
MEPKQIVMHITDMMEKDHAITMNDNNKNEIIMLLKQLYGNAYKSGMEEGISVANQVRSLKER